MERIEDIFGSNVFSIHEMEKRLDSESFNEYKKTIDESKPLSRTLADKIALEMKNWAIEKGVTHFTHWFQPMTGITAEKHDSFIERVDDSTAITKFSGKLLIKGEPDASSFPSGGLRATFEARGYTIWDPTSPCFIQGKCLYIPTAFCSYKEEALDKKTPLLRSMESINKQSVRILKLLGYSDVKSVKPTVGPEQEYFLIDKKLYEKRKDLMFTGRTLFGNKPVKSQEMNDHYFGSIKPRVQAFMNELNTELWKLGVFAKTEHNEVAPAQHELAPIFTSVNIASDHNQIIMVLMKRIADKHGMVCLLHEKPFNGVNGSGKHNNWSLSTDKGINLLEPGENPKDNIIFLLFLAAIIKSVDDYQDLLRISVASAANDHRLGANEAPPAIISVFLGDELDKVVKSVEGLESSLIKKSKANVKVDFLPTFTKDTTDRNRTSPFAFTGNKFEFRMVGSSDSIACANIMINTAVADALEGFINRLLKSTDIKKDAYQICKETFLAHERIIFNGNGYDDAWVKEAERRGLLNLKTTPDALKLYTDKKNVELFERQNVLSLTEINARKEILLENYNKTIRIEALTTEEIARKEILPAVMNYSNKLAEIILSKKELGSTNDFEIKLFNKINSLEEKLASKISSLDNKIKKADLIIDYQDYADNAKNFIIPCMEDLRKIADSLEALIPISEWPFPSYEDLLFSVK